MEEEENSAIRVDGVYKNFRLPHEQSNGLKQVIVNFFNRKKGYETQKVLRGVSFNVQKGDFFGIVGKNGSGKSTLLKLLAGIYSADQGSVGINGSLTPFIELGVGFNPELTGKENVYLNGALLGFSKKEMDLLYDDIVAFAELDRFMDQKLKNYSSGMQVRLAFSIAIRADTDILILDEVLAVGDAAFQQKCFNYFEELKNNKKTIVFVTHDMASVKRFCNKAILLEGGEIKLIGKPEAIAEQYALDNIETSHGHTRKDEELEDENEISQLDIKSLSPTKLSKDDTLKLEASFSSKSTIDAYFGLSISREGVSVAEINSRNLQLETTSNKKRVAFIDINLGFFNPGVYNVNIAVFDKDNRALLDSKLNCLELLVTGSDETRGGAIFIDSEWKSTKS